LENQRKKEAKGEEKVRTGMEGGTQMYIHRENKYTKVRDRKNEKERRKDTYQYAGENIL
jgi:hypothetical protein